MANFPCPNVLTCPPGTDAERQALRNLTAELPDRFTYFGQFQCAVGPTNPAYAICESVESQRAADLCAALCLPDNVLTNSEQTCSNACGSVTIGAGRFFGISQESADGLAMQYACAALATLCLFGNNAHTCTIECPEGGIQSFTIAANSISAPTQDIANSLGVQIACNNASAACYGGIVFNTEQSCRVECPNGAFVSYTIPAGIVAAFTEEDANAQAQNLACVLALLSCDTLPPLVGNETQTCTQLCDGRTIGYTVPAGAFIGLTQIDANNAAYIYACMVLAGACQSGQDAPAINVGNTTQTCSVNCAGGGSFVAIVRPGTFRGANLAIANAAAASYACALANANLFCLGTIPASACVGEFYAGFITTGTDVVSAVTSGVLPTGLTLSAGFISGIPTIPGTYNFTVTARANGGTTQNNYTITVRGFLLTSLPAGTVNTAYTTGVLVSGYTNPFFAITGGSLPTGLAINPSTGTIFGTPTEAGLFNFAVSCSEGVDGATCTKAYSIEIVQPLISAKAWWTLDQPFPAFVDSASGDPLTLFVGKGDSNAPGKIGDTIADSVNFSPQLEQTGTGMRFQATGISFALWFQRSDFSTTVMDLQIDYTSKTPGGNVCNFELSYRTTGAAPHRIDSSGSGMDGNTVQITGLVVSPAWNLLVITFDPADGRARFSLNNGALTDFDGFNFTPTIAGDQGILRVHGFPIYFDEVGTYSVPLTQAQVNAIWNGGAGITWPTQIPA